MRERVREEVGFRDTPYKTKSLPCSNSNGLCEAVRVNVSLARGEQAAMHLHTIVLIEYLDHWHWLQLTLGRYCIPYFPPHTAL